MRSQLLLRSIGILIAMDAYSMSASRLSKHCKTSHWFDSIARVDVERFPSRQAALAAERRAIRNEKPLHNIAGRVAA
jgi:hypothetical protein